MAHQVAGPARIQPDYNPNNALFVAEAMTFMPGPNEINGIQGMNVTVEGEPKAQESPSISKTSGRTVVYDPSSKLKKKFAAAVKHALTEVGEDDFPFFPKRKKLRLTVRFYLKSNRKDLDNMLKFLGDAIEGLAYPNDKEIFETISKKIVNRMDPERTIFWLQSIPDPPM
jgi:Holliday junction resolvase RusA-like endonuclease